MHKAPQSEVREGKKMKPTLIIYCEHPIKIEHWKDYIEKAKALYSDKYELVLLPYPLRAEVNSKEQMSIEYLEVHEMD